MSSVFQIIKAKLCDNKQASIEIIAKALGNIGAKIKIWIMEKKKQKYYAEIGKKVCEKKADVYDATFKEDVLAIRKIQNEIDELEKTIQGKENDICDFNITSLKCLDSSINDKEWGVDELIFEEIPKLNNESFSKLLNDEQKGEYEMILDKDFKLSDEPFFELFNDNWEEDDLGEDETIQISENVENDFIDFFNDDSTF